MKVKAESIRAELNEGEKIRKYLMEKNLLREDLKIYSNNEYIYFPIKKVTNDIKSYNITKILFSKKIKKPRSYKEIITLPEDLRRKLPNSYDIIGDIILIKLSEELLDFKRQIGEALLKKHPNIKTVYHTQSVQGEYRIREIQKIAGKHQTTTTHKEHNLYFNVDVKKTYFSPRLATERKRIVTLVKSGEIIVDMFTGVAPFSIMIAKYANPKIIYAIDKNKEAIHLAQQNIRKNNVLDKIELINSDIKDISKKFPMKADRIIMNLPKTAHLFFNCALYIGKKECIIHYYDILKEKEIPLKIKKLQTIAQQNNRILNTCTPRKIKTYAPREFYIGIDITAQQMPM